MTSIHAAGSTGTISPGLALALAQWTGITPTQVEQFVQDYLTANPPPGVVDATTGTKGVVQLSGDLGGSAAWPTVPGLAGKADASTTTAALAGKVDKGSLVLDATDHVSLDGTTDDHADWVTLFASIPGTGATIYMPANNSASALSQTLEIPNKVSIVGGGRDATGFKALSGFTGTSLLKLGKTSDSFAFGTRVENMMLNCGGFVQDGIASTVGQELSGAYNVVITGFTRHGLHYSDLSQNMTSQGIELVPHTTNTGYGVYINDIDGTSAIIDLTIAGNPSAACIYALNSHVVIVRCHVEQATDGIVIDGGSASIHGVTGHNPSVIPARYTTNLVKVTNGASGVATGLVKNSAEWTFFNTANWWQTDQAMVPFQAFGQPFGTAAPDAADLDSAVFLANSLKSRLLQLGLY